MDRAKIRTGLEYRATQPALTMDIYHPPDWNASEPLPAVLFVLGYPDPGFQKAIGCKAKEMASYVSWSKLVAASGLAAITYTNAEPVRDVHALLDYVRQNSIELGIDQARLGLWACSGNVPTALSILMECSEGLKCAVLCYGFMLDSPGSAVVAEASAKWGFVNAIFGKSIEGLPANIPLFVARAGQDSFPNLNNTIDSFIVGALACNLPVTVVNHATAPHAFDLMADNEMTREIIRQMLAFMTFHLSK